MGRPIEIQIDTKTAGAEAGTARVADSLDNVVTALEDVADAGRDAEKPIEDVSDALDKVGKAGKDGGTDAERGIGDVETAAKTAAEQADKLDRDLTKALDVGTEAKTAGDSIKTDLKGGLDGAGEATETFKNETRANLSESVSSFRGDVEDIPQLLQDVLGGVSADLGGMGAGVAIAGAAAIGIAIAQLQGFADKVNEAKEEMGALAQEILDAGGDLSQIDYGGHMREWAFEIQDARSWFEVWQKDAINNLESVATAADDAGQDLSTFWNAMASPDAAKSREYLEGIQGELGNVTTKLEDALTAQGSRLDATQAQLDADTEYIASLTAQKDGLTTLVGDLEEQVEAKEKAYDQSVILRAAEQNVSEEYIRQADELATLNGEIQKNNDLNAKKAEGYAAVFLAEGEYTTAISEATTKIQENNTAIADANTTEAERTALLQENKTALVDVATEATTYATTMAEAGRSQDEVNGILTQGRTDFLAAAEAAGIGATEAGILASQLGLVPGSVKTEVTQPGMAGARTDAQGLATDVGNVPDSSQTTYSTPGMADSRTAAQGMKGDVEKIPTTHTTTVNVNVSDPTVAMQNAVDSAAAQIRKPVVQLAVRGGYSAV